MTFLSKIWTLKLGVLFVFGACIATALCTTSVKVDAGQADSLFAIATGDTTRRLDERIEMLTRALNADRDRADIAAELGRLFMQKNTPASRLRADRYLYRAVVLEPDNMDYRMDYATLQRKRSFRYNAMKYFEQVLALDSTQVDAVCEIGDYYLQDMFKYVDARRFDGGGSMRSFAMESVKSAAYYYHYALAQDPNCRRAYYGLGLLSLEGGYDLDLIVIAQELLDRWPNDRDGFLLMGLGKYATGHFEEAKGAFERAFELMDPVGQAAMTSVELLGGGGDDHALFWARRDPLFLTDVNERRLAHRGRVAYANLRFGLPDEGIPGWETDMGKTWIRYGRYGNRVRTMIPHREIWMYEDFVLEFFSYDSIHWKLELMTDERWALVPGGWGRSQVFDDNFYRSEYYVDPYADDKYGLPVQVGVFKADRDQVRLALSWGIPKGQLSYLQLYDTYQVDIRSGVFAHRLSGEDLAKQIWQSDVLAPVATDSLQELYLLGQRDLIFAPDSLAVAVEVRDETTKTVGVFRDTIELEAFPNDNIAMSSILLATDVVADEDSLMVTPNPLRLFARDQFLYMYFEIYNLARDTFGQTTYSVAYRIGPPDLSRFTKREERKVVEQLVSDDLWRIAVSADYEGDVADEKTYLAVDLSALPAGVHLLSVVVTDKKTGMQTWRETLFRLM